MRRFLILSLAVTAAGFATGPVHAKVVETRSTGFTVEHQAVVPVQPAVLFKRFGQPNLWWNADHTWWGKSQNLSMKLKAGGCFCERTPDGSGEAEHMRVIFVEKNKTVRLSGALGPLSMQAASGAMTVTFVSEGDRTKVTMRYDTEGHFVPPPEQLAPLVDMVLGQQFTSFTTLR